MNSTAVDFGNRVKSQREYLQFSQEAFAHKIGKTQPYVSLVENGKYYPDSGMREKISEVLNVSVKYLLGEESQVPITKPTDDVDENHHVLGYLPFVGAERYAYPAYALTPCQPRSAEQDAPDCISLLNSSS